jgi:uncharacterized delta-60 repeat protein
MHRAIFAVALGTLALPAPAGAAVFAGDLDAAFSGDGFLSDSVSAEQDDFPAAAVHVLADGRILVANTTDFVAGAMSNIDFAVQRLLPDGSRDPTFGGGDGIVTTPVGPTNSPDDVLDMAVQPDGKIVVAGRTSPTSGTGGDEFAVVRLEADGDLDPAFDGENADSGDGIVRSRWAVATRWTACTGSRCSRTAGPCWPAARRSTPRSWARASTSRWYGY